MAKPIPSHFLTPKRERVREPSFDILGSSPLSELSNTPAPPTPPAARNPTVSIIRRRAHATARKCSRQSRLIPPHLRDTIKIMLEEELYTPGIELLSTLVTQGLSTVSYSTGLHKEVFLPPNVYLQVCTTLAVHPAFTTHMLKKEKKDRVGVAKLAARYLRRVGEVVGTKGLKGAWKWERGRASGRRFEDYGDGDDATRDRQMTSMDEDDLDLKIAKGENLFSLSEDFWGIVGWGFTCSVMHKRRWRWWKVLLEIMLEIMERDWEDKLELVGLGGGDGSNSNNSTSVSTPATVPTWRSEEGENIPQELRAALILKYLPTSTRGSAAAKRIVRAIFANGKGRGAGEWKEIFPGETEDIAEQIRKKRELDAIMRASTNSSNSSRKKKTFDSPNFLEGLDEDEDDEDDTDDEEEDDPDWTLEGLPQKEHDEMDIDSPPSSELPDQAVLEWGGIEALRLRQRLLTLLSSTSYHTCLPLQIEDLYSIYKDHILPLPLSQFTLFTLTTPSLTPALASYRSSLCQLLLEPLLSSNAPNPPDTDLIDEAVLKKCYLPYPANTTSVQDNAKVAVLMEGLVRAMGNVGALSWDASLQRVLDKGVKSRWEKCKLKARGDEDGAKGLKESGGRLLAMAEEMQNQSCIV